MSTITFDINVLFANDAQTTRFLTLNFNPQQLSNIIFADTIKIMFTHNIEYIDGATYASCISFASGDGVNTTGLKLVTYNNQLIVCSTNHVTSFAAIVRFNRTVDRTEFLASKIVSFILVAFSFFALSISIILFCLAGRTFFLNLPNLVYFNYAIALLLGCACYVFLLPTAVLNDYYCVVAVFITQYTWIAVFAWSFCISIMLVYFFNVKKVVKVRNIKPLIFYCLFGWGVPIFPCAITLFVSIPNNHTDYIHYKSMKENATCFLSKRTPKLYHMGSPGSYTNPTVSEYNRDNLFKRFIMLAYESLLSVQTDTASR